MNQLMNMDQMQLPSVLQNYAGSDDALDYIATKESFPTVSFKGKQFRFRKNGHDTPALPLGMPLPVILLAARPRGKDCAKVFYKGAYAEGVTGADAVPDCYSANGHTPDVTVKSPVNATCTTCPMNAFGTAEKGEGKACKDYKHIFVAVPQFSVINGQLQLTAPPSPNGDVYMMRVPPGSLKNLGSYVAELVKRKFPQQSLITLINFDNDTAEPKLSFTFNAFLPDAQIITALDYVKSPAFLSMVDAVALYDAKQEAIALPPAGIPDDIQMPAALQQLVAPVAQTTVHADYMRPMTSSELGLPAQAQVYHQPAQVVAVTQQPPLYTPAQPPMYQQSAHPPVQQPVSMQPVAYSSPQYTAAPAAFAQEQPAEFAAAPGQLDADKMPWDERIHASTRTMTQDQRWKKKRGVDTQYVKQVMAEVLGSSVFTPANQPVQHAPISNYAPVQSPVIQQAPAADDSLDALNAMMQKWQ